MRSLRLTGAAAIFVLLAASGGDAAMRAGGAKRSGAAVRAGVAPARRAATVHRAAQIIDNDDRMNVNNLDMVVTNHGSLGVTR